MITKDNIQDIYECTPLQEGILSHALQHPHDLAYFQQISFQLKGNLKPEWVRQSLQSLVNRYESLRTLFRYQEFQRPVQIVFKHMEIEWYESPSVLTVEELTEWKKQDRTRGFQLTEGPLIRFALFTTGEGKYELIWSFHHLLLDGWCLGILLSDWLKLYESIASKKPLSLGKVTPYRTYIQWLMKQDREAALAFWKKQLENLEVSHGWKKEHGAKSTPVVHQQLQCSFSADMTARLAEWARRRGVTLSNLIQALWAIVMQRMNHCQDLVFGAVSSGRQAPIRGIEQMVGLLIQTIPIRIQAEPEERFHQFVRKIQQNAFAAERYHYLSLAEIQAATSIGKDGIKQLIAFESYPLDLSSCTAKCRELEFEICGIDAFEQTHYDLNLIIYPGKRFTIKFSFHPDVYTQEEIQQCFHGLERVAMQILDDSELPVSQLSLISKKDKILTISRAVEQQVPYPDQQTLHGLFQWQAEQHPNGIAIVDGKRKITYQELDQYSNQLAWYLREKGVNRETIVGLIVEKSLEMVVAILAILKAGGAYLPIEPHYPRERITYLLQNSRTPLVLTGTGISVPDSFNGEVITLDSATLYQGKVTSLPAVNHSDDLAYLLYTSGSTGEPKGVMVEHRQVIRLWFHEQSKWSVQATDRWAMFHSYCFDVSVGELFGALLHGATLVLVPTEIAKDAYRLRQLLKEEEVTILCQTPSAFSALNTVEEEVGNHDLSLQRIILAGEALIPKQLTFWSSKYPQTKLINMYGPTEAAIYATVKEIDQETIEKNYSNIGKPLPTVHYYILDHEQQLLPPGMVGELYLGGAGIARGYFQQPALTASRFSPDPYLQQGRIYRTGDFVRQLPNGDLEYLGRIDEQVKIRGYRIELGEITTQLLTHPNIKEAVVVVDEGDLCAYVVGDLLIDELRTYLAGRLPQYMIPAHFISIKQLPLTTNGKLDRLALPHPSERKEKVYRSPRNNFEKQLVQVWEDVLQVSPIGMDDDFFRLGGHSLKAFQLINQLKKRLGYSLPLSILFKESTVQATAQYLQQSSDPRFAPIKPMPKQRKYPVTSMQKRLYILQNVEGIGASYHLPLAVEWKGVLNLERLTKAFQQLVARHTILRTSFHLEEGEIIQKVHDQVDFSLSKERIADDEEIKTLLQQAIVPFDLSRAPLFHAQVWERPAKQEWVLMIDFHHLIADEYTLHLLWDELIALYEGKKLAQQSLAYPDVAIWFEQQQKRKWMHEQEKYWLETLKEELPLWEMPTDAPRSVTPEFTGSIYQWSIPEQLYQKLQQYAQAQRTTLYMVLLAVYTIFISKWSKQMDMVIGIPFSIRSHTDLEQIPGMLVNTLPLRLQLNQEKSFMQLLQQVKERMLSAYQHGEYPLDQIVEKRAALYHQSRHPLFETMFVYQSEQMVEQKFHQFSLHPLKIPTETAKFELSWTVLETDKLTLAVEYRTQLYHPDTIKRMADHFQHILEQVLEDDDLTIPNIKLASNQEQQQLLEWSEANASYPQQQTLPQLFQQQVSLYPDAIAVIDGERKLTYRELDQRSNQLARLIQAKGIGRESIVGLLIDRSLEMIISILAVLKAGGAYLPIEPEYPMDRIAFLLRDSQAKLLITNQNDSTLLAFSGECLMLDEQTYQGIDSSALLLENSPNDLAYVIYTSGSTGQPKGVMVEHRQVTRLWLHDQCQFDFDQNDRWAMFHSYCFDVSVGELFGALLHGATLVMIPSWATKDPKQFRQILHQEQVTVLCQTPTAFTALSNYEQSQADHALCIRYLLLAGEALLPKQLRKWHKIYPQTRIFNLYGPTEAAVYATIKEMDQQTMKCDQSNIGRPMPTTSAYVLDDQLQLQPVGVVGELYLGGAGVTRGYLNQPQLTKKRFITHPFRSGDRLYRTGDLARWLPNGEIEYLGRDDDQVKVRGYRIELGEITARTLEHPAVKEAAVILHKTKSDTATIVAYIVGGTPKELRTYLAKYLPDHMLPHNILSIEKLPRTTNGKLDRHALPTPDPKSLIQTEHLPPTSPAEQLLARIWEEVLGIKSVGIKDHFFTIGGDSICAMQVVARLRQAGWELEMKELYRFPHIAALASKLRPLSTKKIEKGKGEEVSTEDIKQVLNFVERNFP
ncbi:amino acid adenylation domain-containing protein [Seinonella peptonophila]|uniref:Amino acid adenylation domain-containing protein n=1 Tax=Seinonella peptonophila TaxID=112248 RepID=A0A1M4VJC3_9BACL|nr:non-ribosomal peptide synthetase [Seinonella peptonophila]SHE68963.1 amino acid adenylation domain-containing protein [Seinonella peptonophila]